MKHKGIVAGIVTSALLLFAHAQQPSTPRRGPGNSAEWEYKTVSFDVGAGEASNRLNALAADGWQYVGPLANGLVAFRRPSAEGAAKNTGRTQPGESREKGAGDRGTPPRSAGTLPKGAVTLNLPDEPVSFRYAERDGEGLVEVTTKGLTLRLPRVFMRDGDNVLAFEASKDKNHAQLLNTVAPDGYIGLYFNHYTVAGGTNVVRGTKDGGFGLIRPGDVVVTSPQFKIEISPAK